MSEVKVLLKEAREAINKKKFDIAEECCKKVLHIDKQNYMALVMVGAALGERKENDKALAALRRATQIEPTKPLAWQGLLTWLDKIQNPGAQLTGIIEAATNVAELRDSALGRLPGLLDLPSLPQLKSWPSDLYSLPLNPQHHKPLAHLALRLYPTAQALQLISLMPCYTENKSLREFICYYIFTEFVTGNILNSFQNWEGYLKSLLVGIEDTKSGKLLSSIVAYVYNDYTTTYNIITTLIDPAHDSLLETIFIMRCVLKLKQWCTLEFICKAALNKSPDDTFSKEIKQNLFLSLAKRQKWREACQWTAEIEFDNASLAELAVECQIESGNDVNSRLSALPPPSCARLKALMAIKAGYYDEARAILCSITPETATHYLYLAIAYYHLQIYEKCLSPLLQAAKLDPDDSRTFYHLGLYYKIAGNLEKAKKCLTKAHTLNDSDHSIVKDLSEILMTLGEIKSNYILLSEEAKRAKPGDYWANLQLGLHHLAEREWENAIIQLRKVIRCNEHIYEGWESLADAYFFRGSYSSALKCYERSKLLGAGEHAKARAADCTRLLTGPDVSLPLYKAVLEEYPNSLPATRGIAQAHLTLAQRCLHVHLYGIARQHAQDALTQLMCQVKYSSNYVCLWRLLGQGLLFIAKLPEKYSYVYLDHIFPKEDGDGVCKRHLDIFPVAIGCFSRAMKTVQESYKPAFLYEVTVVYRAWYLATNSDEHWQAALAGAMKCVHLTPRWWRCWSLLGSILTTPPNSRKPRYRLAQHAFLKSIQLNPQDAISWANLGITYVKLGHLMLGNRALRRAQDADPTYLRSWIGQAFIAESVDVWEAMDLYRHSAVLGFHRECAAGYAEWSWKLRAPPPGPTLAEDLCIWLREEEPECGQAATFLGGLLEKRGQLNAALHTYRAAARLIQNDTTLINLARISLKTGHAEDAVTLYKMVAEASLESTFGLALSLLWSGKLEEAYAAYESAVEWFNCTDEQKGEVCVALAGVAWKSAAKDQAKTLLFGAGGGGASWVLGAAALAILHSDTALARLILNEIKKHSHSHVLAYNVTYMQWRLIARLEDEKVALKTLAARIHMYPDCGKAWSWLKSAIGRQLVWQELAREIHRYPNDVASWAQLAWAALRDGKFSLEKGSALFSALRRRGSVCKPLSHWLALADRTLEKCCASL